MQDATKRHNKNLLLAALGGIIKVATYKAN